MKPFFISLALLFTALLLKPSQSRANCASPGMVTDTIPQQPPPASSPDKPGTPQNETVQPKKDLILNKEELIKVVPRSRKQTRPKIIQPAVKVRPTRIIKPKIIKIGL